MKSTPCYLASPFFLVSIFSFILFISSFTNKQGDNNDSDSTNTEISENNANASSVLSIKKPFEGIQDNSTDELIHIDNPAEASSHTTSSGTIINIPANAFADKSGQLITSAVDIKYQEIKTVEEIILSGIPMKMIDKNGDTQWMQTAGMFEIQGFQDNKAIQIAEGKNIEIDFVSDVEGEYDFWFFDKEKGNWVNQGTTTATAAPDAAEANNTDLISEISRLQALTKNEPIKPSNDESNKLIFKDLDLSNCPDLKGENEVVLMYAGNNPDETPKNNKWINEPRIWHKKTLRPTKNPKIYELTLLGDKMYQVDVKLALDALAIERESADYKKRLATYRENMEMLRNKEQILNDQKAFRRLVSVSAFGIYNYDILWKRPNAIALNADFELGIPNAVKKMITVYLITDNGRTVVGLPHYDWRNFRYSPSQENKLLAVLPNNKATVFTNDDFVAEQEDLAAARGKSYTFSMGETTAINSEEDLQGILR